MGVLEGKKEILVIADYHYSSFIRGFDSIYRVKCCCALHLHVILIMT